METMVHYCQLCGNEADKLCAACRLVYYCSMECQKLHWKNGHKKFCGTFIVKEDCAGHHINKYLEAARDIERGSIVLIEAPIFHSPLVLKQEIQGAVLSKKNYKLCVTCSKSLAGGFPSIKCSKCGWPCCSKECEEHKSHSDYECEILANKKISFDSLKPIDDINLLLSLRCHQLKAKKPGFWNELLRCCPGQLTTAKPKLTRMMKKLDVFDVDAFNVAHTCVNSARGFCISAYDMQPCQKENGKIGYQDKINMFFFLNASYLSQSCAPNVTWWITDFPECKITVRSNRPIKAGEILYMKSAIQNERRINESDILKDGTMQRRLRIYNLTGRTCCCEKCCDATEFGTYFSAMSCLSCQKELEIEKSKNNSVIDPNLGYFLLANPIPSSPGEMSAQNRKNVPFKCNRCESIKPYSHFAMESSSFASLLVSPEATTVSNIKKVIEENKTLHPNHHLMVQAKFLLLEIENKKFGDFSRYPYKMQRKNTRGEKIQVCRDMLNVEEKVMNGSWTKRRSQMAAELADSLIKNYCQTLDELDCDELEILLGEVDEGIRYFEEVIFYSKNIEPQCKTLADQVPDFQNKIQEGQNLKSQIQEQLTQQFEIEESIEHLSIN